MTPKEKAQELVNSFYNNAESRNKIGAFDEDLHKYNCKKCALIAVDEIISGYEFDSLDIEHKRIMDNINFWDKVKQEIEKL